MNKPDPKPLFLVKPGTISKEDIKRAERMACVCIVECSEPEAARYLVPPLQGDITAQGVAALKVLQWIAELDSSQIWKNQITTYFTKLIIAQAQPVLKVNKT